MLFLTNALFFFFVFHYKMISEVKVMKKKRLIIFIVILAFMLTGCISTTIKDDALKFKEEYESLNDVLTSTEGVYYRNIKIDKNNPIIYTTFKEVKEKIENEESFILYVGFSACPWCRSVIPYVLEEAEEKGIDKIYYINVREDNSRGSDLRGYYKLDDNNQVVYDIYPDKYYHDVLNTLDEFLSPYTLSSEDGREIETGEDRLTAPTFIIYKDGKAIAVDECISEKQKDGYQKLTDEIIDEIKERADDLFQKYMNYQDCSTTDKSCK